MPHKHPETVTFDKHELSIIRTVVWWLMVACSPTKEYWAKRVHEEMDIPEMEALFVKLGAIGLLVDGNGRLVDSDGWLVEGEPGDDG